MSIQPLLLWAHWGAPNPWKVCMVLEALHLPYEIRALELSEVKNEEYVKLNPNGRLPTLEDSNTGLVLWEVSPRAPSTLQKFVPLNTLLDWSYHPIPR